MLVCNHTEIRCKSSSVLNNLPVGSSLFVGATSSTDAVNVVFNLTREVEIDNECDIVNI